LPRRTRPQMSDQAARGGGSVRVQPCTEQAHSSPEAEYERRQQPQADRIQPAPARSRASPACPVSLTTGRKQTHERRGQHGVRHSASKPTDQRSAVRAGSERGLMLGGRCVCHVAHGCSLRRETRPGNAVFTPKLSALASPRTGRHRTAANWPAAQSGHRPALPSATAPRQRVRYVIHAQQVL
jgi:hypothetical protein